MKIRDVNMSLRDIPAPVHVEKNQIKGTELPFKRQLTTLHEVEYKQHIDQLVDSISRQGELLGKRTDIKELQKYRSMITELMNETVSNSYVFTKNSTFDARGRHRIYAMIKKVNANLDDITKEVLSDQADNIAVLAHIDDIRGLLVDIYL